jgi:hypothetical protein
MFVLPRDNGTPVRFSRREPSRLVMRGLRHLIPSRLAGPRRIGDTLWDAVVAAWAPTSSPSAVNRHHQYTRASVETVNDQLEDQFRIGSNHAHTFGELCARVASKLTAHTLCLYINWLLGKADALQIKHLVFPY